MKIWTDTAAGPTYATGGVTVATGLSTVDFFYVQISDPGTNLNGAYLFPVSRSGANATYKIMVEHYDKLTNVGGVTDLPASVSLASANDQTVEADASHVHPNTHDHPATNSAAATFGGGGVQTAVGGVNSNTHSHTFNPPNFTEDTGAGDSHEHTWNNLYEHNHTPTNTETNATYVELPNGTDLSDSTLIFTAAGS